MSMSLGALALLASLSSAASLAGSGLNASYNKALQEDAQSFNSEEADKARSWQLYSQTWQNQFNAAEALKNRNFIAEQAQLERDFSVDYDSKKYQRMVDDMKLAGINPAVIAGNGGFSSAPFLGSTGGATASAAHVGSGSPASINAMSSNPYNFGNILSSAFSTALNDKFIQDRQLLDSVLDNSAEYIKSELRNLKKSDYQKDLEIRSDNDWESL